MKRTKRGMNRNMSHTKERFPKQRFYFSCIGVLVFSKSLSNDVKESLYFRFLLGVGMKIMMVKNFI